jgi:hypothetical protein
MPTYETPTTVQPHPVESHRVIEPVIVPQETLVPQETQLLNPEPLPEGIGEEFSLPIPAPPVQDETTQHAVNPFLTVSQTEELEAQDATSSANPFSREEGGAEQPRPVGQSLSRPWADALGLPAQTAEAVKEYRRN